MDISSYIPSQEQFQTVIDNLTKACEIANHDCPVQMRYGSVDFAHPCGTPMCHAGWYAIAVFADTTQNARAGVDYREGAQMMAKHLGFDKSWQLTDWAAWHDKVWGNSCGDTMFSFDAAFTGHWSSVYITDLQQIIDHWKGVKERAAEVQNKPSKE